MKNVVVGRFIERGSVGIADEQASEWLQTSPFALIVLRVIDLAHGSAKLGYGWEPLGSRSGWMDWTGHHNVARVVLPEKRHASVVF